MNTRTPRLADLARQFSESTNRLVDLARAAGRPELGEFLVESAKRWPDPDVTLLVIGERSSGKSDLVNALAGTLVPPLLPLASGVTIVRNGPEAQMRIHRPGLDVEHRPLGPDRPPLEPTDTVEVLVPDPPVGPNVVLVDTPPLGTIGSGSRAVVDALLRTADAVILTSSADAPLTAAEVDVLVDARRRAGAALVVITHTDRFRGWRTIRDESDASVRRRDPRLLAERPLPFAAPLAADAAAPGEPEAMALAEESGLTSILDAIRVHVRDNSRQVRLLGLTGAAADVADELLDGLGPDARTDRRATLVAERDRLRERSRTALVDFADGCGILRESVAVDVGRAVQHIIDSIEDDLGDKRDVEELVDATRQRLDALRIETDAQVLDALGELASEVMASILEPTDGERSTAGEDPGERPAWVAKASTVTTALRLRLLQAMVSTTGGAALLYTLVADPTGGGMLRIAPMGISMLVGGIGAAEGFREARQQRTLQDARMRVRSVVDQWRAEYLAKVREQLLRQQRERERALRETIEAAMRDVEGQLAALDSSAPATDAVVTPDVLAARLTRVRADLEELAAQLVTE